MRDKTTVSDLTEKIKPEKLYNEELPTGSTCHSAKQLNPINSERFSLSWKEFLHTEYFGLTVGDWIENKDLQVVTWFFQMEKKLINLETNNRRTSPFQNNHPFDIIEFEIGKLRQLFFLNFLLPPALFIARGMWISFLSWST